MRDLDWKARFRETKVTVGEDFLNAVEGWWTNSRSPLIMQGSEALEKAEQASTIAVHSGMHAVKITCCSDLTFDNLYGTASSEDEFQPGTLGEILMQGKDTCLILDSAENYPKSEQMVSALINFCENRKMRIGCKEHENLDINIKTVLTTTDIEKIDFLLKPWIYAKTPSMNST